MLRYRWAWKGQLILVSAGGRSLTALAASLIGLAALTGRPDEVSGRQPLRVSTLWLQRYGLAAVEAGGVELLYRLDGLEDGWARSLLCLHMHKFAVTASGGEGEVHAL